MKAGTKLYTSAGCHSWKDLQEDDKGVSIPVNSSAYGFIQIYTSKAKCKKDYPNCTIHQFTFNG